MQALKRFLSSFLLISLLAYGPLAAGAAAAAPSAAQPAAGKSASAPGTKVNGTQLLAEATQAVAGILKEAKSSQGSLDPKSKQQAPFFAGLKELQQALATTESKLKAKDKKLFEALAEGSTALAKVKTVWPRLGVTNSKVDGYLGKLDNSYNALRSRYGSEGVRAKQGGALSAKEKAHFEKVQAGQADFAQKLAPMRAKAKQSGDKGTEAQIARLLDQSNKIAAAQLTLDAFLTMLLLLDYLEGEWWAYSYYVGPEYQSSWAAVDVWVVSTFDSYDSLYVQTVATYSVESWEYWEVSMELDVDVEFEVTDVYAADVAATTEYFEASFEYEELSWETYSKEFATAEMEQTVYEEEEVNLDVAEEAWEDEGLDVEAGDDLLDEDDADDLADDDDGDGEDDDAEGDDDADDDGEDDDDGEGEGDDDDADSEDDGEDDDESGDDDGVDDGDEDSADDDEGDDAGDDDPPLFGRDLRLAPAA